MQECGYPPPMSNDRDQDTDDARVKARAEALLPEEVAAGSADPEAQAAAILEESDEREGDGVHPPGPALEHRRSEDTVDPPEADLDDDQAPTP
jgi:hypothetical protein